MKATIFNIALAVVLGAYFIASTMAAIAIALMIDAS
jgi:hypothetical protein